MKKPYKRTPKEVVDEHIRNRNKRFADEMREYFSDDEIIAMWMYPTKTTNIKRINQKQ